MMLEKLAAAENRYEELNMRLSEPETIGNRALYASLLSEHSDLEEIVTVFRQYKKAVAERDEALSELNGSGASDPEFREV